MDNRPSKAEFPAELHVTRRHTLTSKPIPGKTKRYLPEDAFTQLLEDLEGERDDLLELAREKAASAAACRDEAEFALAGPIESMATTYRVAANRLTEIIDRHKEGLG